MPLVLLTVTVTVNPCAVVMLDAGCATSTVGVFFAGVLTVTESVFEALLNVEELLESGV